MMMNRKHRRRKFIPYNGQNIPDDVRKEIETLVMLENENMGNGYELRLLLIYLYKKWTKDFTSY